MYVDERHAERAWALLAWLARVGLAPLFLAGELYYRFADSVAAARSDLDPSLPPDPVSTTRFLSDAMAARALLAALLDVVPDAKEVPPSPDWANVDPAGALRVVALSSPRLDAEQILVSWDEQVPARTFVWLEFEGLASGDPIEWGDGEDLRIAFWTTVGILRDGVRYHRDRRGRADAWIYVAEAGGWTRWGVDHYLGALQPRWFKNAPEEV